MQSLQIGLTNVLVLKEDILNTSESILLTVSLFLHIFLVLIIKCLKDLPVLPKAFGQTTWICSNLPKKSQLAKIFKYKCHSIKACCWERVWRKCQTWLITTLKLLL